MDYALIAKAVGALGVIGLVASAVLATAAKRFHVEIDPRVEQVLAALPGSNCGACGNPSCFAAAEHVAVGDAPVDVCVAGGQTVATEIASIMGEEACEIAAVLSARHCGGGTNATRVYEYSGVPSCAAAQRLAGGPIGCAWGCLGLGDCARACPFDAMTLDARGLPVIDPVRCTGCGICVRECPRGTLNLLELLPELAPVVVRCGARDKIKPRRGNCTMCCIACKKCERECPSDAIHVIDLVAVVDYEKCTGCGTCVEVCPQRCIDFHGRRAGFDAIAADGLGAETAEVPDAEARSKGA